MELQPKPAAWKELTMLPYIDLLINWRWDKLLYCTPATVHVSNPMSRCLPPPVKIVLDPSARSCVMRQRITATACRTITKHLYPIHDDATQLSSCVASAVRTQFATLAHDDCRQMRSRRRHGATWLAVVKFLQTHRNCRHATSCEFRTHRRRDSTRQFRRVGVGGVYWALGLIFC